MAFCHSTGAFPQLGQPAQGQQQQQLQQQQQQQLQKPEQKRLLSRLPAAQEGAGEGGPVQGLASMPSQPSLGQQSLLSSAQSAPTAGTLHLTPSTAARVLLANSTLTHRVKLHLEFPPFLNG